MKPQKPIGSKISAVPIIKYLNSDQNTGSTDHLKQNNPFLGGRTGSKRSGDNFTGVEIPQDILNNSRNSSSSK